jgi:hypothetical protein
VIMVTKPKVTVIPNYFTGILRGFIGAFHTNAEAIATARKINKHAAINKRTGIGATIEKGYAAQVTKEGEHLWVVHVNPKK